jgi:crotonobetainyl-CoA:carnitine CoA-transferase CaiB-like acyl-CoA transferase
MFPENSIAEAVDSEQVRSRGFVAEIPLACGGTASAPTWPYLSADVPFRVRRPAPTLGRDNDAVFRGRLGLTAAELDELRGAGVV